MEQASEEGRNGLEADIARIEAMRRSGTVTGEEADRLIAVLREIAAAEVEIDAIEETAVAPPPPLPPAPAAAAPTGGDRAAADVHEETVGAGDVRWLRVSIMAGDVRIHGADVREPSIRAGSGSVALERDGDGWVVRHVGATWLDRLIHSDVEIDVPRSMGVRLDVKAGTVTVGGVRAVTGRMLAGDLTVHGVAAIDLDKSAGDLDARLHLTSGRHRIRASAGDVDVTLLRGSDVAVTAAVTMGDAHGPAGFSTARRGMGGVVEGSVGAGAASLDVRLSAGDVRIDLEGGHA